MRLKREDPTDRVRIVLLQACPHAGVGLVLIAALLLGSCVGPKSPSTDAQVWSEVPNSHALGFRLLSSGSLRRAIVFGSRDERDTLADLVITTERSGPLSSGPSQHVLVSLDRIAVVSTTHLSFLAAVEAADRVVAAAYLDQVRDPLVLSQLSGVVRNLITANGVDREQLIDLAPDALLDHPFGRSSSYLNAVPGIPVIPVTEYLEVHPLGRVEWIRFFGAILGKERMADSVFHAIRTRYEAIARDGRRSAAPPTVFIGSVWQGQWFVPGADSFMASLVADAGGQYVFADKPGTENLAIDLETLLDRCRSADRFGVLLDLPEPISDLDLAGGDRRVASLEVLKNGGFYGNSATHDLFGRALLEPEVMLEDLRCIIDPDPCSGRSPQYFGRPRQ